MKQTILVLLGLIVVMVLAGCTMPSLSPHQEETNTTNTTNITHTQSTGVIRSLSLDSPTMFEGSETNLILTLQNDRAHALNDVRVEVGNRGNILLTRRLPSGSTGKQYTCAYGTIPADTGASPSRRCVWAITAPTGTLGTVRNKATYPLTTFVTYSSVLTPEHGSLQIDFKRQKNILPGDIHTERVRAADDDISVTMTHESPVAAEDATVPVTIKVRNRGDGTIVSGDQDRRGVIVKFTGTLADANWDMQKSTCADGHLKRKAVFFPSGAQQAEVSCKIVLADPSLAGKTYFVRPNIQYRYRVLKQAPLTVMKRGQ